MKSVKMAFSGGGGGGGGCRDTQSEPKLVNSGNRCTFTIFKILYMYFVFLYPIF